jgi:hypothetical protein
MPVERIPWDMDKVERLWNEARVPHRVKVIWKRNVGQGRYDYVVELPGGNKIYGDYGSINREVVELMILNRYPKLTLVFTHILQ